MSGALAYELLDMGYHILKDSDSIIKDPFISMGWIYQFGNMASAIIRLSVSHWDTFLLILLPKKKKKNPVPSLTLKEKKVHDML